MSLMKGWQGPALQLVMQFGVEIPGDPVCARRLAPAIARGDVRAGDWGHLAVAILALDLGRPVQGEEILRA